MGGLPVSVQMAGRRLDEVKLLGVGRIGEGLLEKAMRKFSVTMQWRTPALPGGRISSDSSPAIFVVFTATLSSLENLTKIAMKGIDHTTPQS